MEVSRILRVLLTIVLVVTFIVVTVAAYRQNQEVNSMTKLSDSTSSIATRLISTDLIWVEDGTQHPYVLDPTKIENSEKNIQIAGENLEFQTSVVYLKDGSEHSISPLEENISGDKMTCSLSVSVALRKGGVNLPARLKVMAWYA